MSQQKVIVEMTWDEARALAYASHIGLEDGSRWPSAEYRATGNAAREKLLQAASAHV